MIQQITISIRDFYRKEERKETFQLSQNKFVHVMVLYE